ncbi:MAG: DUF2007 domain-containing protein [Pirellulales bacterium]
MALRDPIAAYNAANNLEASIASEMLNAAGVEAHAVEDGSLVGYWAFGVLPEIHKPQVWIERADADKAKPLLEKFERDRAANKNAAETGEPISVVCEDCGKQAEFPASRLGAIETCPHCGAYVDVGDPTFEGWEESAEDEAEA